MRASPLLRCTQLPRPGCSSRRTPHRCCPADAALAAPDATADAEATRPCRPPRRLRRAGSHGDRHRPQRARRERERRAQTARGSRDSALDGSDRALRAHRGVGPRARLLRRVPRTRLRAEAHLWAAKRERARRRPRRPLPSPCWRQPARRAQQPAPGDWRAPSPRRRRRGTSCISSDRTTVAGVVASDTHSFVLLTRLIRAQNHAQRSRTASKDGSTQVLMARHHQGSQ